MIRALDPPSLDVAVKVYGHAYIVPIPVPHTSTMPQVFLVVADRDGKPYVLPGVPSAKPTPPSLPYHFDGVIIGAVTIRAGQRAVTAADVDARHGYAPQPEVFNAVTHKIPPNPDWEYVEEKQLGSAIVHRRYTVPRTETS